MSKPPDFFGGSGAPSDIYGPYGPSPISVLDKCLGSGGSLSVCLQQSSLYGQLFEEASGSANSIEAYYTKRPPSYSPGDELGERSSVSYTTFTQSPSGLSSNGLIHEYLHETVPILVNSTNYQSQLNDLASQLLFQQYGPTKESPTVPYGYTTASPNSKYSYGHSPFYSLQTTKHGKPHTEHLEDNLVMISSSRSTASDGYNGGFHQTTKMADHTTKMADQSTTLSPFMQMMMKRHPHASFIRGPPPKHLVNKNRNRL